MRALLRTSFVLVALVAACGRAPSNDAERLGQALSDASREYDVPRPLLEAIGYSETRWWMHPGEPSIDQGYGVMHLADRGAGGPLDRARQLTGYSKTELETDLYANVMGAAAVLREDADRYFAATPDEKETNLASWWQVVMRYSGWDDARSADRFAEAVYMDVRRGARGVLPDGSTYFFGPHEVNVTGEQLFGEMPDAATPDYAGAHWVAASSNNYTGANRPHDYAINQVVIHTMQGSYNGSVSWFQNPNAQVSAHYCVSSGGDITQMVQNKDIAWHAGNWTVNTHSIGIEHEGYVNQPSYFTEAMYQKSAALTRWLCDTYGIPKDRSHIIGHYQVPGCSGSFGGGSGCHTDPCVNATQCYWDWNHYMNLVNGQSNPPPATTGTLKGFVYSSDNGCTFNGSWSSGCLTKDSAGHYTNVVPGARVYLPENGFAINADAHGYFEFDNVPFGTYHPSGSAPGFSDSGPVLGARTLDSGHTLLYSSFILQRLATTGKVTGLVYRINPNDPSDKSQPVAGAQLNVGTNTANSGADGRYTLDGVAPGSQQITAQAEGYNQGTATVSVTAGQTASADIGLRVTDSTPPAIAFTHPADDTVVGYTPIQVEGTASDADDSLASFQLDGHDVTVTDGKFQASIDLQLGENVVTATGADQNGNQATAQLKVTYDPSRDGVTGKVVDALTGGAISGAVVTSGDAFFQTAADGIYALDLPAGDAAVTAQAQGYASRTMTITVRDGMRTSQDIHLVPTSAGALVAITSPKDKATVTSETVTVTGTSHIPDLAALKVNDEVAQVKADGTFSASVKLVEGTNTIVARGKSTDGLEASAQVTVTYTPIAKVKSGCGCSGGFDPSLAGLLAVALLALARRRARG